MSYYIGIDADGQAYIAHGNNTYAHMYPSPIDNHKYIVRIPDPNHLNKYRYFYSLEEYQAYLRNQQERENEESRKRQEKFDKHVAKPAKKVAKTVKETSKKLDDVLYTDPLTKKKVTKKDLIKFLISGVG